MNFLKNLLIYWLESVKIFLPQNLKLAFLLTLKNLKDALPKKSLKPLNILPKFINIYKFSKILLIIFVFLYPIYMIYKDNFRFDKLSLINFITINLLFSLFLYLTKPTIRLKNSNFNIKTTLIILGLNLFFLANLGLLKHITINESFTYNLHKIINHIFMLNNIFYTGLTSPLLLFLLFFALDSKNTLNEYLKALVRAFLMFIYNYPFCFITFNFLKLLTLLILKIIIKFLPHNIIAQSIIELIIFITLFFSYNIFLMNFYINQIHTKFDLYYKKIDI